MIRRAVARYRRAVLAGALLVAVVLMAGVVAVTIVVPTLERTGVIAAAGSSAPTGGPGSSPTPSTGLSMGGAVIPNDAQCSGCHATTAGMINLVAVPIMGHPLEGWGKCTACHAPERLVATAPGHSGIHATECTVCHKPGNLPAPLSRPHRENQNVACLSCHGSTAPLPTDMTHRTESVCWLCHRLPTIEPPVPAHQTAPGEADCLTCHVAGGRAGKLPADHLERPASLCLSCHEVKLGATPADTPSSVTWPAPSSTPAPLLAPLVPIAP